MIKWIIKPAFFLVFKPTLIFLWILFAKRHSSSKGVTFFCPPNTGGWILEGICKDLMSKIMTKNLRAEFVRNYKSLLSNYILRGDFIFTPHQSIAIRLVNLGFNPESILSFYTHSRPMCESDIAKLSKIKCLLVMNKSEVNFLFCSGIPFDKLVFFPAGINLETFNVSAESGSPRTYDILIVTKYVDQKSNPHYARRKNYDLIFKIMEQAVKEGMKVAVLGPGWDQISSKHRKAVDFLDVPYSKFPDIYKKSKLYLNCSIVEGGPVPLIEALYAGCFVFSMPVGFALDLQGLTPRIKLISFFSSAVEIVSQIREHLQNYSYPNQEYSQIESILDVYTFRNLAEKLTKICLKLPE